jgi:hypothetical protein
MHPARILGVALVAALLTCTGTAHARPLETIVQDDALLLHGSAERIRAGLERARALGMTRVRLTAGWSVIAPEPDAPLRPAFDAADPAAYPAGRWDNLDRAVRLTREAGLAPMIDIAFWAPRWATSERTGPGDRLASDVDAAEYAAFARAVATRYSGTWTAPEPEPADGPPPSSSPLDQLLGTAPDAPDDPAPVTPQPLPAVDLFTIWNEPNHPAFLRPQWVRAPDGSWTVRSAELYRAMVQAAYPAIKAVAPGARVLVGGTAPMGSSTPGRSGVPPLRFLRELACVDADLEPVTTGDCSQFRPIPGDGWAHHPYSLRTTPDVDTRDLDKAPVAATHRVAATLRALVDRGRLAPGMADLWLTEYGYETNAPDPGAPFALSDQARLLAWAEQIATSEPAVRSWPQFQLYDRPSDAPRPGMREFGDWQSGLYFADGTPKPAAARYGVPFVTHCDAHHRRRVVVWGRLRVPSGAQVAQVQARRRGGPWRSIGRPVAAGPGAAVTRSVRRRPGEVYRLRWTGGGDERTSAAESPRARCDGPRGVRRSAGRDARPGRPSAGSRRRRS